MTADGYAGLRSPGRPAGGGGWSAPPGRPLRAADAGAGPAGRSTDERRLETRPGLLATVWADVVGDGGGRQRAAGPAAARKAGRQHLVQRLGADPAAHERGHHRPPQRAAWRAARWRGRCSGTPAGRSVPPGAAVAGASGAPARPRMPGRAAAERSFRRTDRTRLAEVERLGSLRPSSQEKITRAMKAAFVRAEQDSVR